MWLFIFVAIILIVLVIVGKNFSPKSVAVPESNAKIYEAVPSLLTPAERSFFGVLQQSLASDYQIFAKVRLADIVRPVRNSSRSG
jgi:hypothetical protein